jgi:hypothetical protein
MPRKSIGERPMTDAERQAPLRQAQESRRSGLRDAGGPDPAAT